MCLSREVERNDKIAQVRTVSSWKTTVQWQNPLFTQPGVTEPQALCSGINKEIMGPAFVESQKEDTILSK